MLMVKLIAIFLSLITFYKAFSLEKNTIQSFDYWKIIKQNNSCFLLGQPSYSKGFPGFRDNPYFFIKKDKKNFVNLGIFSGFALSYDRPPVVLINNQSFILQSYRSSFASTGQNFNLESFIKALLANDRSLIVTTSNRNNSISYDYYDLRNLGIILKFLQNPC
jgi:hypothetical protein